MAPRRTLLACAALLVCSALLCAATAPTPNSVVMQQDGTMTVDGQLFKVKGIAYSLVPIGESERSGVMGDYFTPEYAYMWARDFPRLRAMGVNTIRIYTWNTEVDHTPFLDACHQWGLKVFITHGIGYARDNPALTDAQRQGIIDKFVAHVKLLGDHPAILMWSFGNELNGYWLGYLDHFNQAYQCGWNSRQPFDNNGCMGNRDPANPGHADCFKAQECIYPKFLGWLNEAIRQAKVYSTRPFTATFADIDFMISNTPATDLIPRFHNYMGHFDVYAFQLYRGRTFGQYFDQYKAEAGGKPLLVAEYGLDAMNDPCGWPENFNSMRPCSVWSPGKNGQPGGTEIQPADGSAFVGCLDDTLACHKPGVVSQAEWDVDLTREILSHDVSVGGFLFEWADEFWKSVETQDHCTTPCPYADIALCSQPGHPKNAPYLQSSNGKPGSAECTYKAHLSCGNKDPFTQDLCGYFLWGAPDNYVNEAYFGLNAVEDCGDRVGDRHHLTALKPRPVMDGLTALYGGPGNPPPMPSCADMRPCYLCTTSHTDEEIRKGTCDSACSMNFAANYKPGDIAPPPPPPTDVDPTPGNPPPVPPTTTDPDTTTPPPTGNPDTPDVKPPTTGGNTNGGNTNQQPGGATNGGSTNNGGSTDVSQVRSAAAGLAPSWLAVLAAVALAACMRA